jgi:hypothetical protein
MQNVWDTMKRPNQWIKDVEGEEIQTKGIDNLLNRITAENFPKLKKERVIYVQKAYRTTTRTNKETSLDTS